MGNGMGRSSRVVGLVTAAVGITTMRALVPPAISNKTFVIGSAAGDEQVPFGRTVRGCGNRTPYDPCEACAGEEPFDPVPVGHSRSWSGGG